MGIFVPVKRRKIQSVFLVLILIMPLLLLSVTVLVNSYDEYELCELAEEEQSEERESEEKEVDDDIEEFVIYDQASLTIGISKPLKSFLRNKKIISISRDILTPPPKFT